MSTYRRLLEKDYVSSRPNRSATPPPKLSRLNKRERQHLDKYRLILFNLSIFFILLIGLFIIQVFLVPLNTHWYLQLLIAANIGAFIMFGTDKILASQGGTQTRMPELFFHLISLMGGALGIIVGSRVFHHKTLKMQFLIWPILIFVAQVILMVVTFLNV